MHTFAHKKSEIILRLAQAPLGEIAAPQSTDAACVLEKHIFMKLGESPGPTLDMLEVFGRTGPQTLAGRNFGP